MAIGCGLKCSKGVLISFNLLFWVTYMIKMGIWIILDATKSHLFYLTSTEDISPQIIEYLAYFLIAIGCVIILVGFLGCCGSLYERRYMLITYFVFLFLLLCAELSIAVVTLVYREQLLTDLETRLITRFQQHYGQNSDHFTQAVDQVQFTYNCCGIMSDQDYLTSRWRNDSAGITNRSKINVPLTCCVLANPDVSNSGSPISVVSRFFTGTVEESWQHPQARDETACQDLDEEKNKIARHKNGCLENVEYLLKIDTTILIGLGIGIASFQVLGMIFSISLCRNLGDGRIH
ncbi:hypothetical protein L9F63_016853 [Diploptera punctata]|uniref:Tetraspanin n=1 Tax=Diploptera punctata TaxID=6984 RepID=A0AAD8EHR9_DIPPU|nr:hypothetical protein L9F63_016853 [Diploptera punctata]